MPVTCLPSSLPLSSPLSPPPSPLSPPPSPRLPPEREDGGEESYLYMEAPEYLYMPPLYLRMEELDEQDEAESLRIEELNKQNEAEYLGLETWVTWPTFANVGVSVINHRTSPGCWLGSEEYPSLD
jgi:hypothetical protein